MVLTEVAIISLSVRESESKLSANLACSNRCLEYIKLAVCSVYSGLIHHAGNILAFQVNKCSTYRPKEVRSLGSSMLIRGSFHKLYSVTLLYVTQTARIDTIIMSMRSSCIAN